jgi:hypothetical protein
MTLRRAADLLENAMAEEFENYEARMAEARRAVERWEAEGGSGESGQLMEQVPRAARDGKQSLPRGGCSEAARTGGGATER